MQFPTSDIRNQTTIPTTFNLTIPVYTYEYFSLPPLYILGPQSEIFKYSSQ